MSKLKWICTDGEYHINRFQEKWNQLEFLVIVTHPCMRQHTCVVDGTFPHMKMKFMFQGAQLISVSYHQLSIELFDLPDVDFYAEKG